MQDKLSIQTSKEYNNYLGKKLKSKTKYYSKIVGYDKVLEIIFDKIKGWGVNVNLDSIIIFNSFNDTKYLKTIKYKIDLVSFSSIIIDKDLLTKFYNYLISQSSCILT